MNFKSTVIQTTNDLIHRRRIQYEIHHQRHSYLNLPSDWIIN